MGVLLNPNKNLIHLEHLYIERERPHGSSTFTFVNSKEELENHTSKGFILESDIQKLQAEAQAKREEFKVDSQKVIHAIHTDWTPLNWKNMNNIYSTCMKQTTSASGEVNIDLDVIKFRDQKLKACLKQWDVKDDSGQVVSVTVDTIDMLAPEVAQKILEDFEKVTEVSEQDLKN